MLILLPPSEGKACAAQLPGKGVLSFTELSLPALNETRERVALSLIEASAQEDGPALLKVSDSLGALVAANGELFSHPVGDAGAVYTGVLYEAARMADLLADPLSRARLRHHVLIASALYGMVSPTDPIAPYRMNMDARLPALDSAGLAGVWRPALHVALDTQVAGDVVIDARSGPYAKAWTPPASADHLAVRVEREVDGERSVVSHSAKQLRGVLAGHLIRRTGEVPGSAEAVLEAARELLGSQVGTATTPLTLIAADLVPARRGPDRLVLITR